MPDYRRYAIYFTPRASGPLAEFGARWLGWDIAVGKAVAHPVLPGLPAPMAEITQTPQRYGFHATMKPPFSLGAGDLATLRDGLATLCQSHAPVMLEGIILARLGRFLALVPHEASPALTQLAAACVQDLDALCAPMTEAELERRRAARLTPEEEANLIRWGYPYVMERFRWHMTLTGKLPKAQVLEVERVLRPHIAPLLEGAFVIDALSLVGEDAEGMFHLIQRRALTG
ncbi:DUF1045 domain-containing protein [Roseovarius sp. LXJ103]|uniref:DUF1045 domain-containing protein n=1 Tax=Roseovarius carneus TaxID=2853164 RepID=UPI000D61E6EE|nr:DUF1045 domain-containing protein [Roseovarius carneus]MBZ8117276.1 DUF1045 domain-containing protein [Roseovarius carneus]PWE36898.1 phosphonate metabolism protein [Pelagicola sp. LXJ1103]